MTIVSINTHRRTRTFARQHDVGLRLQQQIYRLLEAIARVFDEGSLDRALDMPVWASRPDEATAGRPQAA